MTTTAPRLPFEVQAAQRALLAYKRYWSTELFREVVARAHATGADTWWEIERALQGDPVYDVFGWLERYIQQFKYHGPRGLLAAVGAEAERLGALLDAEVAYTDTLRLDPSLELPAYYVEGDFHQHPGGVWSDDVDAFVYEIASRSTRPMMQRPRQLYERYVAKLARPDRVSRVLDLGCGLGKSLLPLADAFPDAHVVGVDLSAPNLKLAHLRAREAGADASFVQTDAAAMELPDDDFDLVSSIMLVHEMPPDQVVATLRECARVLRPGGRLAILDFYVLPGGAVAEFLHLGHAVRNYEHHMQALLELDLEQSLHDAGFVDVSICAFEEEDGVLDRAPEEAEWRFPWTIVEAEVPV